MTSNKNPDTDLLKMSVLNCNRLCWLLLLSFPPASIYATPSKIPPCPSRQDTAYPICPYYDDTNNPLAWLDPPVNEIWQTPLQDTFSTPIYNSCPPGHDTTILICPYQSYTNNFLVSMGLPANGIWEPPLHSPNQWEYNSCFDSASDYIFTRSVPGCPDVQDTVHFDLRWNPPCDCAYEACYIDGSYSVTIPPLQEFNGKSYGAWIAVAAYVPWTWEICGDWILSPDSTHFISCGPGWDNTDYSFHCVDISITDPSSGCSWLISTYNAENWDCDLLPCKAVAVEPVPTFESIKVYPVPTGDVLFIDIENPITEVRISGADDRLLKQIKHPDSNQIEVGDLGPGWYLLRILDGHRWYHARIVK